MLGEDLPFRSTIMVIGLAGVGKTALINRILDRDVGGPYAETDKVRAEQAGRVQCTAEQSQNV